MHEFQSGIQRKASVPDGPLEAVIMAGGYGTRLGAITRSIPKPMVPVAGRPAITRVLEHLEEAGIRKAAISLHHLSDVIRNHLDEFPPAGIKPVYSVSEKNLGTAGGVRRASRLIQSDPVLIMSGDVLTDADLNEFIRFHRSGRRAFSMLLTRVEDGCKYGVAETDGTGRIVRFVEKPMACAAGDCWVSGGIYLIDRSVLDLIPEDTFYDISRDLIPLLMKRGESIGGYRHHGYWFDIGTPKTLSEADEFLGRADTNGAPRGSRERRAAEVNSCNMQPPIMLHATVGATG